MPRGLRLSSDDYEVFYFFWGLPSMGNYTNRQFLSLAENLPFFSDFSPFWWKLFGTSYLGIKNYL